MMETPPVTYRRAAGFRRALTPPEARLWACLKGKRVAELKLRRQHPIGPYILDFYCPAAKLAVEVDGASHEAADGVAGRTGDRRASRSGGRCAR